MMEAGKKRAGSLRIGWVQGNGEALGFLDDAFDAVIVGFGIRNMVDRTKGLKEILRVLKEGGRLLILEFSVPDASWIQAFYEWYFFKLMPAYGRLVTGEEAPFRYLAESVRLFPPPEMFEETLKNVGFSRVGFKRLSEGVVSVYFGEKPETKSPSGSGH
jgi:demethylmenaquinone methyltransferase/2-methoxy-6-polyprenyl-1,4-benzoquinol methylase